MGSRPEGRSATTDIHELFRPSPTFYDLRIHNFIVRWYSTLRSIHRHFATFLDLLRYSFGTSLTFFDIPRSHHLSSAIFLDSGLDLPRIHPIFVLPRQPFHSPDFGHSFLNHHRPSMNFPDPFLDVPLSPGLSIPPISLMDVIRLAPSVKRFSAALRRCSSVGDYSEGCWR
jgi:hypothetical protein